MAVINIIVVATRLYWFERRLRQVGTARHLPAQGHQHGSPPASAVEATSDPTCAANEEPQRSGNSVLSSFALDSAQIDTDPQEDDAGGPAYKRRSVSDLPLGDEDGMPDNRSHIAFAPVLHHPRMDSTTLYIPPPNQRDQGRPFEAQGGAGETADEEDCRRSATAMTSKSDRESRWNRPNRLDLEKVASVERVASSLFVLGQTHSHTRERSHIHRTASRSAPLRTSSSDLPRLSSQVTVGRNSQFHGLSVEDRELLGGIEYRSLKLLLWICIGYFIGLHVLGVICLVPWILHAPSKYTDYLDEEGQNIVWWAFYSAQTMANNLGFTLTPDSMVQFRDATFPMLIMTFLAYAGYNFYPIFLRVVIWTIYKIVPRNSALREPLNFLLQHPRRCCMLLFPSRPTWILFGFLFALNFIDALLLIVLDLDNPSVTDLPLAQRILAAVFQAASSRHTGTSTFNLADLNPAAQFSLLVMMYISVYPIALTIRASNTYEERSLGKYAPEQVDPDEEPTGGKYVMAHIRNQLSFDLWYVFLGIFLICIAESDKVRDTSQPLHDARDFVDNTANGRNSPCFPSSSKLHLHMATSGSVSAIQPSKLLSRGSYLYSASSLFVL
ncbi:low-affinity potassium transport protein [Verticillium dahliae VdLs.17]|uniref:Low-affinity potassium transport protein n=1 Tax=Verticillium dahliae (strain VdLs.17 / ATCC MYA-4575 / FGSC 10137) TaxID=498257 RepID=G2X359_VERDV|nr:low-affinity potassium transport protein [Verticillium dahliae VdLs.17]EGY23406.1 low-affinity potassium transport protein [Verticillium dahliae VdLs.17]